MDGSPYYRGIQTSGDLFTRNDWRVGFDYNDTKFDNTSDRNVGINVIKGRTNRFQQFGLRLMTGKTADVPTTYIGPSMKLRLLKKFDILYSGGIQNRAGVSQQHVISTNYEISPNQSFGGRVVAEDARTNAFFFYRHSGGRGTEFYVLFGDPNPVRGRTVRSLQVKAVFAF